MELFKIFGTVALNGMDQFNSQIDSASKKGSSFASILGQGLKGAALAGGAAIAAAATGIAALTKVAVANYAEYEQLVGGVETLFGDSADELMKYANEAYKTAGLSANDYMETVTSFSASLLQSLGGDTAKAVEVANRALIDMADNANKMGTDMASIQNAYQGFAKANYTMLDNLKLGYGGTQSEMKRLIQDAAKLKDVQKELGITVDANSMSFDNIINAISVVQKSMGIMGATAAEASSTIQGSIATMQAAWQNFLTGMADPTSDFDALINNLVDSVEAVISNLVPRIMKTIPRLVKGLSSLGGILADELPGLIDEVLGTLLKELPNIVDMLVDMIGDLVDMIGENGDEIADAVFDTVETIISGLAKLLPKILKNATKLITDIVESLVDALPDIVDAAAELLVGLADGLVESIHIITDKLPVIIEKLVAALNESVPVLLAAVVEVVTKIIDALPTVLPQLVAAVSQLISQVAAAVSENSEAITSALSTLLSSIAEVIPELVEQLTPVILQLVQTLLDTVSMLTPQIAGIGTEIILNILSAFAENYPEYFTAMASLVEGLITAIGENAALVTQLGCDLVLAIADAISQSASDGTLVSAAESLVYGMWDAAVAAASALGQAICNAILEGFGFNDSMFNPTNWGLPYNEVPEQGTAPQTGQEAPANARFNPNSAPSSSDSKKRHGSNPSSFNPGSASPQSNGMPSTIFNNNININAPKATPAEMLAEANRTAAWAAMY